MRTFRVALPFLAVLLTATVFTSGAVRADSPGEVISKFNDTLLETMRAADELGYQGRYEKLSPAIQATFNLPFMARFAAGNHWQKLTEEQQREMVDAFSRLTIATYASRFNGYDGETFRVVSEQEARGGTMLVNTELATGGDVIRLNYLMRPDSENWRVIDVFMKGNISELATRRSEYSSMLDRQGFDSLITLLNQRIEELQASS